MAIYNPDAPRRLPLSRREKLIRAAGAIVLLGTTAWLLANWGSLPVRLPSHYGFDGEIDGWSGRGSLGLLLGIGWGVWLLLAVTRYFPRGWSFSGLPVTDRTRPMLYCLLGEMLTVLQLVIALIFASVSGLSPSNPFPAGGGLPFSSGFQALRSGISGGPSGWDAPRPGSEALAPERSSVIY